MYLKIDSEHGIISDIRIFPEANEDVDNLYKLSQELKIMHPCIPFSSDVKAGKYDDLSDAEYEALLNAHKKLKLLFKNHNDPDGKDYYYINIFLLLERLLYNFIREE